MPMSSSRWPPRYGGCCGRRAGLAARADRRKPWRERTDPRPPENAAILQFFSQRIEKTFELGRKELQRADFATAILQFSVLHPNRDWVVVLVDGWKAPVAVDDENDHLGRRFQRRRAHETSIQARTSGPAVSAGHCRGGECLRPGRRRDATVRLCRRFPRWRAALYDLHLAPAAAAA